MKRVYAIIQARTGSSRLPKKIFSKLGGKFLLWHVIDRLKNIAELDGIAIATTTKKDDDEIETFAKGEKQLNNGLAPFAPVKCFRGDEKDVLLRYIKAAEFLGAEYIIRITGDAPLICPKTISDMINLADKNNYDYVSFEPIPAHVFEGVELVSLDTLKKIYKISNEAYVHEHVTIYVKEHPDAFNVGFMKVNPKFLKSRFPFEFKLSVDTKFDLDFMTYIYDKLYNGSTVVDFEKALDLIESDPDLQALIKSPTHKSLKTSSIRFGFLTNKFHPDGLSFARLLRDNFHYGIYIFAKPTEEITKLAKDEGFNMISIEDVVNIDDLKRKNSINFLISYK